jgi:hypothetical protein
MVMSDRMGGKDSIKRELVELLNFCNFEIVVNKVKGIYITPELEAKVNINKEKIDLILMEIGRDYRIIS